MITQEMKDQGVHCKGQGFNCPTCKDKLCCAESTELKPLGIMPREIWDKQRMAELKAAIDRYTAAGEVVPIVWVQEYNELARMYPNKVKEAYHESDGNSKKD